MLNFTGVCNSGTGRFVALPVALCFSFSGGDCCFSFLAGLLGPAGFFFGCFCSSVAAALAIAASSFSAMAASSSAAFAAAFAALPLHFPPPEAAAGGEAAAVDSGAFSAAAADPHGAGAALFGKARGTSGTAARGVGG